MTYLETLYAEREELLELLASTNSTYLREYLEGELTYNEYYTAEAEYMVRN